MAHKLDNEEALAQPTQSLLQQVRNAIAQQAPVPCKKMGVPECLQNKSEGQGFIPFFLHSLDSHPHQIPLGFAGYDVVNTIKEHSPEPGMVQQYTAKGPKLYEASGNWYKAFILHEDLSQGIYAVSFAGNINTPELRTQVMHDLTWGFKMSRQFMDVIGWRHDDGVDLWRHEHGRVLQGQHPDLTSPLSCERTALILFGFIVEGVTLHVYTKPDPHDPHFMKIWVSRRSYRKQMEPGKLDNCVTGGIPADCVTLTGAYPHYLQALEQEASEEANYKSPIISRAVQGPIIVHRRMRNNRANPDRSYTFDLELDPSEFYGAAKPENTDGEVEEFIDMSPRQIIDALEAGQFAASISSNINMIDFLMRHGCLDDMKREEHDELKTLLESLREVPYSKTT